MSALSGVRIIEVAGSVAGEFCGKLLSDFGAEIIKVEGPEGSPVRRLPPFAGAGRGPNDSALFAYLNTNKRSVVLDLESDAGISALGSLVERADAVIDDHAPGWLAALGLDPGLVSKTRPDLVLCTITPFGLTHSGADAPAEDLTVFHAGGWGYHTPSGADPALPPLKGAGRFGVSYEAAMDAALCISAALFDRHTSGKGRVIDISKQRTMISRLDYVLAQMAVGDMDVTDSRAAFDLGGPAAILPCADGFIYMWLSDTHMWKGMGEMMGNPGWMDAFPDDWLQKGCTPDRVAVSRGHITEWLKTQNKHEVAAEAQRRGIMICPVNNAPDLIASPQYQFRSFFQTVEHPAIGPVTHPTVPYKMSASPAAITRPAPLLGADSETIVPTLAGTGEAGR